MSHFTFDTEISNLMKLDAPTNGPAMRWQRKACEASACNSSMNKSLNMSLNKSLNASTSTPMRVSNKSFHGATGKTPSKNKTPGKSKTPSKTPTRGDRFIPNRSATNYELSSFMLSNKISAKDAEAELLQSPSKLEYQQAMSDNLNGHQLNSRILSYKNKPPAGPEGFQNNLKVLYSQNKTPGSTRKTIRHIPQVPERILDAPEILDDYYLNLIDWSCHNHLAVALANNVYLWNGTNGEIKQLMQLESPEDYIASVSFIKEGNYLAIGTSTGDVQLWDVDSARRLRNMPGHAARVGSLSWNSYILSSGSRTGNIHHHDVRVPDHHVGTLAGHTQEICGLKWSPDGRYLASGANDNLLNIWQPNNNSAVHTISQHQAAVKALAWCPWQSSVLASGGGTADRHIRFWNVTSGACLSSVDTKSQVCALLWSKEHRELLSAHGYAQNQLIVWKYPTMTRQAELLGHTSRILHMAMSPDGSTVVSAAADETLRLWKCFAMDPAKKKDSDKGGDRTGPAGSLKMRQSIR